MLTLVPWHGRLTSRVQALGPQDRAGAWSRCQPGQARAEGVRARVSPIGLQTLPYMGSVPLLVQPVCSPSLCHLTTPSGSKVPERETLLCRGESGGFPRKELARG